MTPNQAETILVRQTVFDLDAFEDAYIGKRVGKPQVTSMADALALVNGDASALLDVVRTGLVERAREDAKQSLDGWLYMSEGNPNETTDKPFGGTIASKKGVDQTIMTLAKTVFGYVSGRGQSDQQKAKNETAKERAGDMVRNNSDIREGLKAAAMESED